VPELSVVTERLRTRLWPIPAVAATVAALAAGGLSTLRPESDAAPLWWPGEPASARGLLEVLAGSSLTVVALVFSLQVVALQLAATQYSPRLLRTYARDPWIQASLSVLIATFVFSLVTLGLFGTVDRPPRVSVTIAVLLGLASVGALVGVVAHIVASLRVETMMADIHADADRVVRQTFTGDDVGAPPVDWPAPARAGDTGSRVSSPRAGFVQSVDRPRLVRWAAEHDAFVQVDASAGTHVLAGRPLATVWPSMDDTAAVGRTFLIGYERTPDEDPGFGLMQLVDVAVRALSPSVNDPTTAVHAIGHLASLVGGMSRLGGAVNRGVGPDGAVRVVMPLPSSSQLLTMVCRPVVRSGAAHPQALMAVLDLLGYAGECGAASLETLQNEVDYVLRAAERGLDDPTDRRRLREAAAAVLQAAE
jgi:uncharacterized membrane protein